jgi:hypothetical protein
VVIDGRPAPGDAESDVTLGQKVKWPVPITAPRLVVVRHCNATETDVVAPATTSAVVVPAQVVPPSVVAALRVTR